MDILSCFLCGVMLGLYIGFRAGVYAEDRYDMKNGYNYRRVRTPGGKVVILPKKRK